MIDSWFVFLLIESPFPIKDGVVRITFNNNSEEDEEPKPKKPPKPKPKKSSPRKTCITCGISKTEDQYQKRKYKSGKVVLRNSCRICENAASRQRELRKRNEQT